MLATEVPYTLYFDKSGKPLDGGYIFFGVEDENPETNPTQVFWDVDGTQPVAQPVRTIAGFPVRAGTIADVYCASNYSITVKDKSGQLVRYVPSSQSFSLANFVTNFVASLATGIGSSLVGWISNLSGAITRTVQSKLRDPRATPFDFGAVGGGSVDDGAAIDLMLASGKAGYIPDVPGGFRTSRQHTITSDLDCDGYIVPDVALGAVPVFTLAAASFGITRKVRGLRVWGSAAHQAAGLQGLRNDCPGSHLIDCDMFELGRGYIIRAFSVTMTKCTSSNCALPNSAYARDSSHEINAFHIDGGSYTGTSNGIAWDIGDTSWPDAMGFNAPNGTSISHGVVVTINNCANFDGGSVDVDNVSLLTAHDVYFENSGSNGCGFRLGSVNFDGNLRNADIDNVFFKNMKWATKCFAAVNGLEVGRCFYTAVTHSALHVVSDLYHFLYTTGDPTASFTQGQEVHTGFRSLPAASITFVNATIPHQGLARGVQELLSDVGVWFGGGQLRSASAVATMNQSAACRFYTSPALTKAGTVSAGGVFTFTTLADCYAFNGGDAIVTAPAGATYVRSVDYEAGTMIIDGGTTANGAATVSQRASAFFTVSQNGTGAAPSTGTAARGDISINTLPTVGQPKGWRCTAAGSPGTWVSEGNL